MKEKPKPRASGPRRLTVAELRLWRSVTENVVRRLGASPLPEWTEEQIPDAPSSSRESARDAAASEPSKKIAPPPLAPLETRLRQRLARGRVGVEDTLDLHGYRQDQAHRVLRDFLIRAQARGAKVVLVVTGKGRTAAEPEPMTGVRSSYPLSSGSARRRQPMAAPARFTCGCGGRSAKTLALDAPQRPVQQQPISFTLEHEMPAATYDVLGIGNAIVDILMHADDDVLIAHRLHKGSMQLVDEARVETLQAAGGKPTFVSGGSAANTTVGLARLGCRSAFIGKVKADQAGDAFTHDIRAAGVHFATPPTCRCCRCATV